MVARALNKLWYARALTPLRLQWELLCILRDEFKRDRRGFQLLLKQPEFRYIRSLGVSVVLSLFTLGVLALVVKGFGTPATFSNLGVSFLMWFVGLYVNTKFVFPDRHTDMLNRDIDELFGGSGRMLTKTAIFVVASQGSYILLVGIANWPFLLVKLMQWPVFGPLSYLVNTFWVYPKIRKNWTISGLVKRRKKV